ncbi:conserved hypothetical protein [delta proteobacterium NaphS2]|nr:conserved hypothetical protein [delta proteobacterium NaphS2]
MGGDTSSTMIRGLCRVSIHAPAWGATKRDVPKIPVELFQSTPPHGGRRCTSRAIRIPGKVSIHAPAWGATSKNHSFATVTAVSIHAPAWGATSFSCRSVRTNICFNPRPRMGGDVISGEDIIPGAVFQSTPPHGGRPSYSAILDANICFNPRPRMGGDFFVRSFGKINPVSIHAPAWGATTYLSGISANFSVSIHAPAWGATSALKHAEFKAFSWGLARSP